MIESIYMQNERKIEMEEYYVHRIAGKIRRENEY